MTAPAKLAVTGRDWTRESGVTLAGGNWIYPLVNILDARVGVYTETTSNALIGNTSFTVDLGTARRMDLIWFDYLRAGFTSVMEVYAGNDATFVTNLYDSTQVTCWPKDTVTTDNWGNATNGVYLYPMYLALGMPRYFRIPSTISARYIKIAIDNSASTLGPLRIGTFGVSELAEWEMRYNWQMTFLDESQDTVSKSGTTYTNLGRRKRRLNMGFTPLPDSQMFGKFFDWLAWKGQSEPFVILPYDDSTYVTRWEKVGLYGKRSNAPGFTNPFSGYFDLTLQVDQL